MIAINASVSNILLVGLVGSVLIGCSGQNGSSGSAGPAGPTGPSGFQEIYQNDVYPSSSYSNEFDAYVSGNVFLGAQGSSPYLELTTGNQQAYYTRILVQFTNFNLPSNVNLLAAEVWMTLETATNVSGSVTIGAHAFSSSVYPTCAWNGTAYWDGPKSGSSWSACDNDQDFQQDGYFISTPMSTTVISSSANGTNNVYRFLLNVKTLQTQFTQGIIQFVLRSEGEFSSDGNSSIGFYPNTDTAGKAPKLILTYQ